jgi:hypothetical protein
MVGRAQQRLAVAHQIKTTTILAAVGALFVVYFPIALWLKYSYTPSPGPPGSVWKLMYFRKFDDSGIAFVSYVDRLRDVADASDAPDKSPVIIYEDSTPLGPAHSVHDDISKHGHGRFSHWGKIVIFSTSDNSDPNTNGREYWAVLPKHREVGGGTGINK